MMGVIGPTLFILLRFFEKSVGGGNNLTTFFYMLNRMSQRVKRIFHRPLPPVRARRLKYMHFSRSVFEWIPH